MRLIDLTGQRFGRLTVIERAETTSNGQIKWLCKCDCGKTTVVRGASLKNGDTRSCGCLHDKGNNMRHGKSNTNIYSRWCDIKRRCTNPNNKCFARYGGRGIAMCERWLNSFEAFEEDVSKLPHFGECGYTLHRIDNDGNYEPNNVKWANDKEQANHRRSNIIINYDGRQQTLKQWTEELGLDYVKTRNRIRNLKWSIERAFNTP